MRRCEWILKQASEAPGEAAPGEAHAGRPGPAAGLNKYGAEQTCRQLGPDMAAAVCVVDLRGHWGESRGAPACFLGEEEGGETHEENKWHLKTRYRGAQEYWWFYAGGFHKLTFHPTGGWNCFPCYILVIIMTMFLLRGASHQIHLVSCTPPINYVHLIKNVLPSYLLSGKVDLMVWQLRCIENDTQQPQKLVHNISTVVFVYCS